jgi:hypothetical protein
MDGVTLKRKLGARIFSNNQQAEAAGKELLELELREGALEPKLLVSYAATHPDSNLHSFFEWDDSVAAKEWRLAQARLLIRSIVFVRKDDPRGAEVRLFVSIDRSDDAPSKYVNTQRAMEDDEMRLMILRRVEHQLASIRRKHIDLHELAGIWASIDEHRWDTAVERDFGAEAVV